jgi:two-component system osmolarity sensor histidine kinase EnvZ
VKLIPQTLFGRNALLILGLIGLAQLTGLWVFRELVQKPRTAQLADLVADYVSAVVDGLQSLAPEQRELFLHSFVESRKVELIPTRERMPDPKQLPNRLWRQYARFVAERLHKGTQDVVTTADHQGSLWVRVAIGGEDYWLIVRGLTAGSSLSDLALVVTGLIVALAIVGAFVIQRRINRPLRRLVDSARQVAEGRYPSPLVEEAPAEIATVTRAFNQMTRSLAAIDQERSLMLAGVSHDLRTPLSKVRLAIEITEAHIEPDLLSSMRQSLKQIDVIIDQFMDYERVNIGEAAQQLDVNQLVRECAGSRASAEMPFELLLQPVPTVSAQRQSLLRAITNLMDNAVRYGAPAFAVGTRVSGGLVGIAVLDNGPGIASHEIELMKQPFRRGSAARSGVAGSGLGLAIVERVAQQQGGRLILANRAQGGLEARIELPSGSN